MIRLKIITKWLSSAWKNPPKKHNIITQIFQLDGPCRWTLDHEPTSFPRIQKGTSHSPKKKRTNLHYWHDRGKLGRDTYTTKTGKWQHLLRIRYCEDLKGRSAAALLYRIWWRLFVLYDSTYCILWFLKINFEIKPQLNRLALLLYSTYSSNSTGNTQNCDLT